MSDARFYALIAFGVFTVLAWTFTKVVPAMLTLAADRLDQAASTTNR